MLAIMLQKKWDFASAEPALRPRFFALDLMRGIAAFSVVCLHIKDGLNGLPYPASGMLAVDLFFLLSGFVIAAAYEENLRSGLGTWRFLRIRLIRLYPLYLLGLAIGLAKLLLQYRFGANPLPPAQLGVDLAFALVLLPSPTTLGSAFDGTFPINLAAWSLFFEIAVNVAYAIATPVLSRRFLIVLVLAAGALLIGVVAWNGSIEVGQNWHSLAEGVPRVVFPFFLGVLLHRMPLSGLHIPKAALILLAGLLAGILWIDPGQTYRAPYDLISVCLLFPALVIAGSVTQVEGLGKSLSRFGGDMSYAVYILHLPILSVLIATLARKAPAATAWLISGPAFLLGLSALCFLADRYYDQPVRRWLTARYRSLAAKPVAARSGGFAAIMLINVAPPTAAASLGPVPIDGGPRP